MRNLYFVLFLILHSQIISAQALESDLGILILDSAEYHYYEPQLPNNSAYPKNDSLKEFIGRYADKLTIHPKYEYSSIYTSVSFTVNSKGSLENFILGDQASKIDTLIVTTLYELGDWVPAKWEGKNQSQRFKLQIQSNDQLIFTKVQDPAEFPGGKEALYTFIYERLIYPEEAKRKKISGRVFISFVVEKNGSLSDLKIEKGIGAGTEEEVLRIFESMPKWKPARQKGNLVRQKLIEGVSFSIK